MTTSSGEKTFGLPQVSKDHYFTEQYLSPARFLGIQAQLKACLDAAEGASFLEIGPGPGLLAALLRHLGRSVITVDFAMDLKPNVVGSLPVLPFKDDAVDVVCAFEVLEHMPLDLAEKSLKEMGRVARRKVIITVPDQREIHNGVVSVRMELLSVKLGKELWRKPLGRLTNSAEHYWEIGFNGTSSKTVEEMGERAGLSVISSYFVGPWFHFFIFEPKSLSA